MKAISPVLPSSPGYPETTLAKNQPQYLPLPTVRLLFADGNTTIVSRYHLSLWERIKLLFTGSLWVEQMTFGEFLQPQRVTVHEPLTKADAPKGKKS